jgi:hypothetical protein
METSSQRIHSSAITKQWKKVHRRSLSTLIALETEALTELRSVVRSSIADVSDELASVDNDRVRIDGMRIVRNAANLLQHSFASTLYRIKTKARVAALEQLDQELAQLRDDLEVEGHEYEVVDPELSTHSEEDHAESELAAASFRAAWSQVIVSLLLKHDSDADRDISVVVLVVPKLMEKRLRRIATTEVSRSYNRELGLGHNGLSSKNKETAWMPLGLRRWDATLDNKVCAECRRHDGEVVPIGISFSGGDEPGDLHPNCRCVSSLVVVPLPAGKKAS